MNQSQICKELLHELLDEFDDPYLILEEYEECGICYSCGEISHDIEPDTTDAFCDSCNSFHVTGLTLAFVELV